VKIPEDVMGDIMGDISQRRGKVSGMDSEGKFQIINADLPLANLHDYATALKSMSSGRGMFSQEFSHYEDLPHTEAEKVKKEYEDLRAVGAAHD
jgi:elongation factor G